MAGSNSPRVVIYEPEGDIPLVGPQASSGSLPVVIANDQIVAVSGTVFTQPVPGVTGSITGSVGITGPITGSVVLASAPQVTQGSTPWIISGSTWTPTVTGSVVVTNRVDVSGTSWIPTVTGSVTLASAPTVVQGTNPWIISGSAWTPSVTGSMVVTNRVDVSGSTWIPTITGSVVVINQVNVTGSNWTQTITGTLALSAPITGTVGLSGPVTGTFGLTGPITGSVGLTGPITGSVKITEAITGSVGITGPITGSVKLAEAADVRIRGKTGATYIDVVVDSTGRLVIAGAAANATSSLLYGAVTTSGQTNVPVRGTTYTEQTASFGRSIASANANDASDGTGARAVTITYYSYDFSGPFTETLTLNGTTGVNTSNTNICFIESMIVVSVGSNGTNNDIITLYQGANKTGDTIGTIAAGDNRTLWAHHYVPAMTTGSITSIAGNNDQTNNTALLGVYAQLSGSSAPSILISDTVLIGGTAGQTVRIFTSPIKFHGPGRIILYVKPGANPSQVSRGSFDMYEER